MDYGLYCIFHSETKILSIVERGRGFQVYCLENPIWTKHGYWTDDNKDEPELEIAEMAQPSGTSKALRPNPFLSSIPHTILVTYLLTLSYFSSPIFKLGMNM